MSYDAILFDFDGVLADSEPLHHACWTEVLQPFGVSLDWDTYAARCIGVSDRAMLEFLASRCDQPVDVGALWPQYDAKKALFRRRIAEIQPFCAGTLELFPLLAAWRLAVVTSSGRTEVEPVLERGGIRGYLSAAVYGEDVAQHKPAPDPYLRAAELLGASRPLVLEDSDSGVASARAAGFDVLRVRSPLEVGPLLRSTLKLGME